MSEQPDKIASIRLDPGTKAFVHLRQKKPLEVDDHPAAAIGDNVSHRCHVAARLPSTVIDILERSSDLRHRRELSTLVPLVANIAPHNADWSD
jgi:hypothetical protein